MLRLLDLSTGVKSVDSLGFSESNAAVFREMIARPYGILLITGPTGSGKTTTLYSALNQLNVESTNIITVEDPVEYQLEGVNQVHVNAAVGLTLRLDCDRFCGRIPISLWSGKYVILKQQR